MFPLKSILSVLAVWVYVLAYFGITRLEHRGKPVKVAYGILSVLGVGAAIALLLQN